MSNDNVTNPVFVLVAFPRKPMPSGEVWLSNKFSILMEIPSSANVIFQSEALFTAFGW